VIALNEMVSNMTRQKRQMVMFIYEYIHMGLSSRLLTIIGLFCRI